MSTSTTPSSSSQKPLILIGIPLFPSPSIILPYLHSQLQSQGVPRDSYDLKYSPLMSRKFVEQVYSPGKGKDIDSNPWGNGEKKDVKQVNGTAPAEAEVKTNGSTTNGTAKNGIDPLEGTDPAMRHLFFDEERKITEIDEEDIKRASVLLAIALPPELSSVKQSPNLKLIQLGSAGWGHVEATPFYKTIPDENPLTIATAAGVHAVQIPEHVISTTMMLYHNFPKYVLAAHEDPPRWVKMGEMGNGGFVIRELRGRRMGILAYGHIARETARMAKVLGMDVVVANRSGKKQGIKGYIIPGTGDANGDIPSKWYSTEDADQMKELYSTCDVIVDTLPSSAATKHFVNADAFRQMRNDAVFVNIGRGDTVDQEALIESLEASVLPHTKGYDGHPGEVGDLRIGSASLDVTDPEPLPSDSKLWRLDNCLVTPHMSGGSEQYWYRVSDILARNFKRVVVDGKGAINAVRGRGEDD